MKHQILLTGLALLTVSSGLAFAANTASPAPVDKTFVTKAVEGGMAEVELGNLAQQNASNEKVKHFGQQMVEDHTKAGDELKSIATGKGMSVPSSIDLKSKATKTRLSHMHGASFDRAYMQDMVDDHKQDVAEFRKYSEQGADADLKAFASKTLPTLEHHLKMAEEALADVKTSGK